jgi:Family of unknown function (DUF6304)
MRAKTSLGSGEGKSMERFSFPGGYEDRQGREAITWQAEPSNRRGAPGYEYHTVIRGTPFWGYDFDGLEPVDRDAAETAGFSLSQGGDLGDCILAGELPCSVNEAGRIVPGVVSFRLDLYPRHGAGLHNPKNLQLATTIRGERFEVTDDWFEDGVLRLEKALPADVHLVCCVTCLFSDYSPGGHGLMGMRCHRDAKQRYLAVKSKHDYWSVPVTEDVIETYLCPEYQRRTPGTGYRG